MTTVIFYAASKVGISVGGAESVAVGPDYVASPRRATTPSTTWFAGMRYYDTALNKERVYNGATWDDMN